VSVQTEVQIMIKTSDLYREQSIQTGGPMVQEQGVKNTSLFVYQGDSVMSICFTHGSVCPACHS